MPTRVMCSRTCRIALGLVIAAGCTTKRIAPSDHDHSSEAAASRHEIQSAGAVLAVRTGLPADASAVAQRLASSPRHGEWAMIPAGGGDSVRAWVEYPERSTKAPVIVVIHEIFGLSTWVRGVVDQLAADGYIAIAPDLLTGKGKLQGDTLPYNVATAAIRTLAPGDIERQLTAVGRYGMSLPAALPRYGVVGFCWGGGASFAHAVATPENLDAAVVYYGTSPATAQLVNVKAPVLGLYGGNDARVDATIPPADSAMKAMHKIYEPHIFPGAGHGFLRAQHESTGSNERATAEAWPLTVSWFRKYLGA
jgi:carboxymethylenebutenolidase